MWKITDFGFTSQGTSKIAYTTHNARGTTAYRAPESINRSKNIVSMRSDIWALGCILYELLCGQKAFSNDVDVYSYAAAGRELNPLDLPGSGTDERLRCIINELLHIMLKSDPWKRPSAQDVSDIMTYLIDDKETSVFILTDKQDAVLKPLPLYYNSDVWKKVQLKRCWYVPNRAMRANHFSKHEMQINSNVSGDNILQSESVWR